MKVEEAYRHCISSLMETPAKLSRPEAGTQARLLIDHLTGGDQMHILRPEAIIPDESQLLSKLAELQRGRPLPYVTGRRGFYGLDFQCDERALIPRAETELLVELAAGRFKAKDSVAIADLGTGTGCLAICAVLELPQATVYATDASHGALALARENAIAHNVDDRISFLQGEIGDWCGPLLRASCEGKLDAILTNPPYIAAAEIETLAIGVREFEPRSALDGGVDGLDDYRLLASQCGAALKPGGFLAAELGAGQFDDVRQIFNMAGWDVEEPVYDFAGIARVLVAF